MHDPHRTGQSASSRSTLWGSFVLVFLLTGTLQGEPPPAKLLQAEQLYLKGRYAEARELFGQTADDHPQRAAYGEARCWQALGNSTAALGVIQGALEAQGEAHDLRELLAELQFQRGEYDAAASHLKRLREAGHRSARTSYLAAELAAATGQLDEAESLYEAASQQIPPGKEPLDLRQAEQMHSAGKALAQLARWQGGTQAYRRLVQKFYPALIARRADYWPAQLEMARLFAEKFNTPAATDAMHRALAINASAGEIYLLRARLAIDEFNLPAAQKEIDRALAANRELVEAYQLRADCYLAEFQFDEALQALGEARKINPLQEATLGRLAAAGRARQGANPAEGDSSWQQIEQQVLQRNPHCGRFYRTLGDALDRMRKYPQAAEFYRRAEEVMPGRAHVEAPLGMIAMRLGEEGQAQELLDQSFAHDPFNIRVKNTLEVLDVLTHYAVLETEHFILRFDRGHDQVMAEAAAEYLEEIYPQLVERLGYEPPQKSLIEVFSRARNSTGHSWFSARMVGLPFIGTVGACAGKMAAIVSPGDGREFHWARVLRHEFVHVVNLQQTDFNIPHWYTEALAVWNEDRPRPPQWRSLLAAGHRSGKLLNLETINMGFIRPGSGGTRTLAYCQAELYAEFMVKEYGPQSLSQMLTAYRQNLTTEQALQECFAVRQADFEAAYREYVAEVIAQESPAAAAQPSVAKAQQQATNSPDNASAQARLALAYLREGKLSSAKTAAAQALQLDDDQQLAVYVIAALLVKVERAETARKLLTDRLDRQQAEAHSLWLLATLSYQAEEYQAAEEYFRLGQEQIPATRKWLTGLGQVYQKTGDQAGKLWLLQQLAEEQEDNFELRKKIVTLADQLGEEVVAGRYAEDACYINPKSPQLWATAARWHALEHRHAKAARRYGWALQLDSKPARWRVARIESLLQNQQFEEARQALDLLAEREPNHDDLIRLQKELERATRPE